jgi:hypothetical protein
VNTPSTLDHYQQELAQSKRSDHLVAVLVALAAALALAGLLAGEFDWDAILDAPDPVAALHGEIDCAVRDFHEAAQTVIAEQVPAVAAAITDDLAARTGVTLDPAPIATRLAGQLQVYVITAAERAHQQALTVTRTGRPADAQVQRAMHDAFGQSLASAMALTARSETQSAYVDAVRSAADMGEFGFIEWTAQATACDECASAAGIYEADDPECAPPHPNCACEFTPIASREAA